MNEQQRKQIKDILASLNELEKGIEAALIEEKTDELKESASSLVDAVEPIKDYEREKFENLSDGLQQAEKGQKMEASADALDEAFTSIESVRDSLGEMSDTLGEVKEAIVEARTKLEEAMW